MLGNQALILGSMCLLCLEQPTILPEPQYLRFSRGSSEALRLEKRRRLRPPATVRSAIGCSYLAPDDERRSRVPLKKEAMGSVLRSGDLELDLGLQRAFRAGRRLRLTRKEFLFLCRLVQARGRMVSRKNLLACVWDRKFSESNILESLVCRLRKKVNRGSRVKLIRNVPRAGYRLKCAAPTRASSCNRTAERESLSPTGVS